MFIIGTNLIPFCREYRIAIESAGRYQSERALDGLSLYSVRDPGPLLNIPVDLLKTYNAAFEIPGEWFGSLEHLMSVNIRGVALKIPDNAETWGVCFTKSGKTKTVPSIILYAAAVRGRSVDFLYTVARLNSLTLLELLNACAVPW